MVALGQAIDNFYLPSRSDTVSLSLFISQQTTTNIVLAATLKGVFYLVVCFPPPRGFWGEGTDVDFPKKIEGLGPVPAQIPRGNTCMYFYIHLYIYWV